MCGNNPNLAPEVNTAKCIGGTALGFAIVTVVGILLDWPGFISGGGGHSLDHRQLDHLLLRPEG